MSGLVTVAADGELRVSSIDVAEHTERDHEPIIRLVRDNLADFESFGRVSFENGPFATRGGIQTRTFAMLNEPQATLLITFMRNNDAVKRFKIELVRQFYEMRQALVKPVDVASITKADLARMVIESEAEREALAAKIEADAPKVGYVDRFVANSDLRVLRNVAKSLGLKETVLREELLHRNWIYSESTERWSEKKQEKETVTRYSAYADKTPYFEPVPVHDAPRFRGEVMHTLKVTPQGAEAIARACERWGLLAGAGPRFDMEEVA